MCGIVGALTFEHGHFSITESYLRRMRDTMVHRGPDGAGLWIADDGRVGFAHRRLSIIDRSAAAAQPMCNDAATLWIVFNGEIYNHGQIRRELKGRGVQKWKTDHSDTEVVLRAFEQWGIDCLERFRGMFAIAVWDTRTRTLWLVRDRIGVKPLYYSVHHGRICFASEIKALLADPDQRRSVHEGALYDYLSFLTTPAPQTLFDGIKKLPGGTWLRVGENGAIRECRYWDVLDHTQSPGKTTGREISDHVLEELRAAVTLRKVSDVTVGVFLSGGVDSSTNTALFSEGENTPVRTFSIGYDGDYGSYRNEMQYARRMAEFVGAEHHERLLGVADLVKLLPEMVRIQDEPIGDPVCMPVYYVSKLARDHGVGVCQVGEGADELFWGYPGWNTVLRLQQLNDLPVPRVLRRWGLALLRGLGRDERGYYELMRRGTEGLPVFWGGAEAFTESQKQRLISDRLRRCLAGHTSWEAIRPIRQRFLQRAAVPSHANWMRYLDLNLRLPELLLMRVDKMSMAVSLETRVPFLDHRLVELAMSIPDSRMIHNGETKHILKQAITGLVPPELIHRPKQGFGVPVYEWLGGELRERAQQVLHTFCRETDFLDYDTAASVVQSGQGQKTWYLLNLAMWWQTYFT